MKKVYPALNRLSYGLYIVSAKSGERANGQIVNTAFQISSGPPAIGVSINKGNYTHRIIKESGKFALSVLEKETPMRFIGLFGFRTGRDIDKMKETLCIDECGYKAVTEHCISYIFADVVKEVDVFTHTLFVGEVKGGDILSEREPLTYDYYKRSMKGKTHKNATTYNETF